MIDQLSNKHLVKKLVVYLYEPHAHQKIYELQVEMIDQLSNKHLLKINGLPGCVSP